MTDLQRWEIFRIVRVRRSATNVTAFWKLLDEIVLDVQLETMVLRVLNEILNGEKDPTTLITVATTTTQGVSAPYIPGLKVADTVEFFEGGMESEMKKVMSRLIGDLLNLIGWVDPETGIAGGAGYGFS